MLATLTTDRSKPSTSKRLRTSRLLVLGVVVCIASTNLCPGRAEESPTRSSFAESMIRLGMVPIMVANEKGFYKETGFETDYRGVLKSTGRSKAVTAGDLAFERVGSVAAITNEGRWRRSRLPELVNLLRANQQIDVSPKVGRWVDTSSIPRRSTATKPLAKFVHETI